MTTRKQIAIIGGGVIGLACAHYLTKEGLEVTVIDRSHIGAGASHGNCGLLYFSDVIPLCSPGAITHEISRALLGKSPLYIKPEPDIKRLAWLVRFAAHCKPSHKTQAAEDKFTLLKYSARLFKTLFDEVPLSCDHHSRGILSVFRTKEKWEAYQQTSRFVEKFYPGYHRLTAEEACRLEPALKPDIAGAWHNTRDQHLRPDFLMASWKAYLASKGVSFVENCPVTGLDIAGGRIRAVKTRNGRVEADAFILATGAWAPILGKTLGLDIPVEPGKGYSITMNRPGTCPAIPCMLYERSMVVTPWESGYRLGGTMEFSGYDSVLTRHRLNKLIDGAKAYLKDPLGKAVVEEWTSLRPMTYDDMPIVDRAPNQKNLVIATGHGMLGLTLATGTGKLVTDLVLERKPEINPRPFGLKRR